MSPLKKEKLSKIRKELDKLDDSLIKIIKKKSNIFSKKNYFNFEKYKKKIT